MNKPTEEQIRELGAAYALGKPLRWQATKIGCTYIAAVSFQNGEVELVPQPVPPGDLTWEEAEQARLAGKDLQCVELDRSWVDWGNSTPCSQGFAYRLKPVPRMATDGKGTKAMNANEPAFSGTNAGIGLTKREYFAAIAMQGLIASWYDRHKHDPETQSGKGPQIIAEASVIHADALLAELEKTNPHET